MCSGENGPEILVLALARIYRPTVCRGNSSWKRCLCSPADDAAYANMRSTVSDGTSNKGDLCPYAGNPSDVGALRYGPGIVWEYTTEPVKAAHKAADMARVPMMVHITDSPLPLPEILAPIETWRQGFLRGRGRPI